MRESLTILESSPIRYISSSSPTRARHAARTSEIGSSSSNLFVSQTSGRVRPRDRRGDIASDRPGSHTPSRRQINVDDGGRPTRNIQSDAATFSNLDPGTSEANALGGQESTIIWGSNISQNDVIRVVTDFLMNYERRYRLMKEGTIGEHETLDANHPGKVKEYVEMMEMMLDLGVETLNLDMKNLKSYPSTVKLWHQMQDFPNEVIDIFDTTIRNCMYDLAVKKIQQARRERAQTNSQSQDQRAQNSSSVPPVPSSEADAQAPDAAAESQFNEEQSAMLRDIDATSYRVRPFNLDKSVNLRDLNPKDIDTIVSVKGLVIRATPVIPDMKEGTVGCVIFLKSRR